MSDSEIFDQPPDDNEAYANLDESLDDEDGVHPGGGPEGARDLDTEIIVDQAELEEAGANLDDPERMSVLDGGMDDPDGSDPSLSANPSLSEDSEAGWDIDPVVAADGAESADDEDG